MYSKNLKGDLIMKKRVTLIVFCALIYFLTCPLYFAEAGHGMSKYSSIIAKKLKGEIVAIDMQAKTITIKQNELNYRFDYDDSTTFQKDKNIITPDEIKTGEKVTVRYLEINGRNVARNVSVHP